MYPDSSLYVFAAPRLMWDTENRWNYTLQSFRKGDMPWAYHTHWGADSWTPGNSFSEDQITRLLSKRHVLAFLSDRHPAVYPLVDRRGLFLDLLWVSWSELRLFDHLGRLRQDLPPGWTPADAPLLDTLTEHLEQAVPSFSVTRREQVRSSSGEVSCLDTVQRFAIDVPRLAAQPDFYLHRFQVPVRGGILVDLHLL